MAALWWAFRGLTSGFGAGRGHRVRDRIRTRLSFQLRLTAIRYPDQLREKEILVRSRWPLPTQ
jgi:hypothetical protein